MPAFGVPASVAVPSLLLTRVTPPGSEPVSPMIIAAPLGKPVVVTANVPAAPTVKVVLLPLVMAGACCTVSVKFCVAFGVTPLFAVMTIGYVPPVPAFGVPASVAVPSPLSTNVTPPGSAPLWLITIEAPVGKPVAVTAKVPAWPTLKVAAAPLVMAGGWLMVREKVGVGFGAMPLFAVMTIGYVPPVPALGVPASVAVPSLLLTKVTPPGSAPLSLMAIDAPVGKPVVVTENVPAWPTLKVAALTLVMAGGWLITRL